MSQRNELEIQRLIACLEEAEKRAQDEKRAKEEAEKRALDATKEAQDAKRAKEESDKRALDATKKVQDEKRAKEEAEKRAQDEKRAKEEAERRVLDATKEAEDAKRGLRISKKRIQNTTFKDFIELCHENLHNALTVETNPDKTTQGHTSIKNRFYPKTLRPWKEFPEYQEKLFDEAYNFLQPKGQPARNFCSAIHLEQTGDELRKVHLANEKDLQWYEQTAVEIRVISIITQLCSNESAQKTFQLGQGITFDYHPNDLADMAPEVEERSQFQTPTRSHEPTQPSLPSSDSKSERKQKSSDRYCVYTTRDGMRRLLFVVEYKPPHKYSTENLQRGFQARNIEKFFNQAELPDNADKLVAAIATQTFDYMIACGLEYSYITTGEAFIFLRIDKNDPTSLYYHVTVPGNEVEHEELGFVYSWTAISQVLSLVLMAFGSEQRSHRWRRDSKKNLLKYEIDSEAIVRNMPESERKPTPSVAYKGRNDPINKRSPIYTRWYCKNNDGHGSRNNEPDDPDTPSWPGGAAQDGAQGNKQKGKGGTGQNDSRGGAGGSKASSGGKQRQYCTQDCLMGMVQQLPLDEECPNVLLHRRNGMRHAIDVRRFTQLVQNQLAEDLDHNCEPLGLQGARGALFRITLDSHGYVFVGKGTVQAFVPDLLHEGRVYRQLQSLQGTAVPVYLGNVDLVEWYYLDLGVRILHMLLMSWGGEMIEKMVNKEEIERTVQAVRGEGIDQGDVRTVNILWNKEKKRAMLIDFERATYIKGSGQGSRVAKHDQVLQEISPNKKQKRPESPQNITAPGIAY